LKIYTLVTIDSRDPWGNCGAWTWGWFPTLEEAQTAAMKVNSIIYENGRYDHCVIEKTEPGVSIFKSDRETWWYKVEYDPEGEVSTISSLSEMPAFAKGTINFGMG
jgi:hypothetical protein